MTGSSAKYSELFLCLTETIKEFLREVEKQRLQNMATEKWTVKDVLCHIAFWHNYYAQNYASLAAGIEPFIFTSKGGSTRNQRGVDSLKHKSQKYLINLINKAQASLHENIVIKKVPKMSYTDRKDYKTDEFLKDITGHIQRHNIQVRRAKRVKAQTAEQSSN